MKVVLIIVADCYLHQTAMAKREPESPHELTIPVQMLEELSLLAPEERGHTPRPSKSTMLFISGMSALGKKHWEEAGKKVRLISCDNRGCLRKIPNDSLFKVYKKQRRNRSTRNLTPLPFLVLATSVLAIMNGTKLSIATSSL